MVTKEQGDDLAGRIRPQDGGFTFNTQSGQHHEGPGFAVAIPGAEERHPGGYDIARGHIQHYARAHEQYLSRQGVHLGGWHDPVTGDRSFDTSEIFSDRRRANVAMVARGEDAMTNMSTYHSIRNPYKEAAKKGKISTKDASMMQEAAQSLLKHSAPQQAGS
jgi:hypothetical protein